MLGDGKEKDSGKRDKDGVITPRLPSLRRESAIHSACDGGWQGTPTPESVTKYGRRLAQIGDGKVEKDEKEHHIRQVKRVQ